MDNDRSLSSGISIPQWMKTRMIDQRLDLDQSTFSPPSHDDNFLYIRYPRKSITEERRKSNHRLTTDVDVTNHTEPCRQYIEGAALPPVNKQLKSSGTDDGFKGQAAACGSSIVRVAQQIVSEKRHEIKKEVIDFPDGYHSSAIRRGSRSLPVSPSTSPKAHRKLLNHNKYFTGAFQDGEYKSGWILSQFLGKREALLSKSDFAASEENVSNSVADLTLTEEDFASSKKATLFKAKPSELREMNFWSPTSM